MNNTFYFVTFPSSNIVMLRNSENKKYSYIPPVSVHDDCIVLASSIEEVIYILENNIGFNPFADCAEITANFISESMPIYKLFDFILNDYFPIQNMYNYNLDNNSETINTNIRIPIHSYDHIYPAIFTINTKKSCLLMDGENVLYYSISQRFVTEPDLNMCDDFPQIYYDYVIMAKAYFDQNLSIVRNPSNNVPQIIKLTTHYT